MGSLLYVLMFAMIIFIIVKNFSLLKRYKFNKKYIEIYREILKEDENAYEHVSEYIASQKKEEYINKAKVLKLYIELKNDLDCSETLDSLDVSKIYYNDKNKFDPNLAVYNSDTFVFIIMCMTKAYTKLKINVIKELYEKVKALIDLEEHVEYQEVLAVNDALFDKDDCGVTFFNSLLNGEYTKLKYDKNMIGIYKRIASTMLSYRCEPISDYDSQDLKTFAKSLIGKQMLSDLKIYDKYCDSEQE